MFLLTSRICYRQRQYVSFDDYYFYFLSCLIKEMLTTTMQLGPKETTMAPERVRIIRHTSSLPLPVTKFNGSEGERLGQLVVTPEVVVAQLIILAEGNHQRV